MKIKYSIIVPVYNAEVTIERCINSLIKSNREDVEIIIVNDGATDNSKQICLSYAEAHPQILYMEKEQGGVSSARNYGLSVVKGEYILFVDSDDYVCDTYFDELDSHLHTDCDFMMFGMVIYDGIKGKKYLLKECYTRDTKSTMNLMSKALTTQLLNSTWNKVFRADIVNKYNLRFDDSLEIGEDKVFVLQYIMHISNALFIKRPLYVFSVENENSLSRKVRDDLCEQVMREHDLLKKIVESSNLSHRIKEQLLGAVSYSYYRSAYTVIYKLRKYNISKKERLNHSKHICIRYSADNNYVYKNIRQWLISIPIRMRFVRLIEILLTCWCVKNK